MKVEVPQFKRCCCCLPLRYGLIVWGYVKLVFTGLLVFHTLMDIVSYVARVVDGRANFNYQFTWVAIFLVVLILDIILNIVYLAGAHLKNIRLLRFYNFYAIFALSLSTVMFLICIYVDVNNMEILARFSHFWYTLSLDLSTGFLNIVLQIYLILLVRSEIMKLADNCKFRFVNNMAEAECVLDIANAPNDIENGNTDQHKETGPLRL